MKQLNSAGLADAESLCGSDKSAKENSYLATQKQKVNLFKEQLIELISHSFDTTRAKGAYQTYKQFKKELKRLDLPPVEYEKPVKKTGEVLGI